MKSISFGNRGAEFRNQTAREHEMWGSFEFETVFQECCLFLLFLFFIYFLFLILIGIMSIYYERLIINGLHPFSVQFLYLIHRLLLFYITKRKWMLLWSLMCMMYLLEFQVLDLCRPSIAMIPGNWVWNYKHCELTSNLSIFVYLFSCFFDSVIYMRK